MHLPICIKIASHNTKRLQKILRYMRIHISTAEAQLLGPGIRQVFQCEIFAIALAQFLSCWSIWFADVECCLLCRLLCWLPLIERIIICILIHLPETRSTGLVAFQVCRTNRHSRCCFCTFWYEIFHALPESRATRTQFTVIDHHVGEDLNAVHVVWWMWCQRI